MGECKRGCPETKKYTFEGIVYSLGVESTHRKAVLCGATMSAMNNKLTLKFAAEILPPASIWIELPPFGERCPATNLTHETITSLLGRKDITRMKDHKNRLKQTYRYQALTLILPEDERSRERENKERIRRAVAQRTAHKIEQAKRLLSSHKS